MKKVLLKVAKVLKGAFIVAAILFLGFVLMVCLDALMRPPPMGATGLPLTTRVNCEGNYHYYVDEVFAGGRRFVILRDHDNIRQIAGPLDMGPIGPLGETGEQWVVTPVTTRIDYGWNSWYYVDEILVRGQKFVVLRDHEHGVLQILPAREEQK